MRKLPAAQRADLVSRYSEGAPVKVLAYEFGINQQYVSRVAAQGGAELRRPNVARNLLEAEQKAQILDLFATGLDTRAIAQRFGVKEYHVYNALARARDEAASLAHLRDRDGQ